MSAATWRPTPASIGLPRGRRGVAIIALAAIGAVLLLNASQQWFAPHDETAYWDGAQRILVGQPLYDPGALPNAPFVYWYPPVLAQVLALLTAVVPQWAYVAGVTLLLLGCLWWLSGRRLLVALAMVAFVPVAVELGERNVHLILAVFIVLALRRSPLWWVPATALKVSPVLGLLYLVLRGRWRDAVVVGVVGGAVLLVSVALSPAAWHDFISVALTRGGDLGGDGLLPVPYLARLLVGGVLVIVASRRGDVLGEILLICALTIANPTLWLNAFSILIAIVPLAGNRLDRKPRPMTLTGPSG